MAGLFVARWERVDGAFGYGVCWMVDGLKSGDASWNCWWRMDGVTG